MMFTLSVLVALNSEVHGMAHRQLNSFFRFTLLHVSSVSLVNRQAPSPCYMAKFLRTCSSRSFTSYALQCSCRGIVEA